MTPVEVSPDDPRLRPLFEAHLTLMRSWSPACSVHAMEADELADTDARFFAVLEGDDAIAMGAIKRISGAHGELKSMHVRADRRGSGLADQMVDTLIAAAVEMGIGRVSLETGSQEPFAPARALYGRHGFTSCGPFEGYGPDPHSFFMTKAI